MFADAVVILPALVDTVAEVAVTVVFAVERLVLAAVKAVWQFATEPPAAAIAEAEHATIAVLSSALAAAKSVVAVPVAVPIPNKFELIVVPAAVMLVTVEESL
jgi:hypothetical protein